MKILIPSYAGENRVVGDDEDNKKSSYVTILKESIRFRASKKNSLYKR